MKIDVDTKQRLMTALIFLTEFYKVLTLAVAIGGVVAAIVM